jgi:hypothetical protein
VISANHITGPRFYEGTLDTECYIKKNTQSILINLAPVEERFGYFVQDGVSPQRADKTI